MVSLLIVATVALPMINLPSNCRAEQKAIPPGPEHENIYENCMRDEQAAHEELLKKWPQLPAGVRQTCAEMGRMIGSYIEVEVCADIDAERLSASSQPEPAPRQKNH
jgi:hypothetical protein